MSFVLLNEFLLPKINTLRFKISVVYVAVIGFILILFQGVLYINFAHAASKAFDLQLQMKADQIGGAVNAFRDILDGQKQPLALASQKALNLNIEYPQYTFMSESAEKFWLADAKKLGLDKDYLIIMDRQGSVITKSKNVTDKFLSNFHKIGKLNFDKNMFYKINLGKDILRIVVMPYFYTYKQGYIISVGVPYSPFEQMIWKHFLYMFFFTLVFLVVASLIVRLFVVRVLLSVMEISKAARNISQDNLHARIKLTHADEEIKHLTGSLNEMIARLEKSFTHVKEFSLEMAHEVKTPLAIISGESQMGMEKDRSTEEYKEILTVVLKEAKRTQKFVSDLLLLTKLDYRLIKLRFEPIDLNEFLGEICAKMRSIAASKRILIQQDMPQGSMLLKGDKIHLRRVFFNLIDNALKFTPPGGCVTVSSKCQEGKAIILVSDNGYGIDQEKISKIFNKFYTATKNDHTQTESGCGLGLSIVHSIITCHEGSISVHSEVGQGTTFRMVLPLI
jgi:two-component system heavy metal sensor histidine kinase CusS